MLHILLLRNSLVPKSEVAMKLLSHRLGLGGTLVLYGMTMGGKDSNDIWVMLLDTGVGVFLL